MAEETCENILSDQQVCGAPALPCPLCSKEFCPRCQGAHNKQDHHFPAARKVDEKKIRIGGYIEYDRTRGVIYFFEGEKHQDCLLRIEGVPPVKIEEGNQIDIHLVNPGGEHHHVDSERGWGDGAICAVKLQAKK